MRLSFFIYERISYGSLHWYTVTYYCHSCCACACRTLCDYQEGIVVFAPPILTEWYDKFREGRIIVDDMTYDEQVAACQEPYWHETHKYCPVCPWTENGPPEAHQKKIAKQHETADEFIRMVVDGYVSDVIQKYERQGREDWLAKAESGRKDQRTAQAEVFVYDEAGRKYRVLCELVDG